MLYSTNKNTDVSIPLYIDTENVLNPDNCSMFRIILIESGSGIIKFNGHSVIITAPVLFCLNEKDSFEPISQSDIKSMSIYFHPVIMYNSFNPDEIYDLKSFSNIARLQDHFYLSPFTERSGKSEGYFKLGPAAFKRITELCRSLSREITLYENEFWACRLRICLFEILCFIQSIYMYYKTVGIIELNDNSPEINYVITYLHTNYQSRITINDLTKKFQINRTTLSEKFHESTGMSIKGYLNRHRIRIAAVMLRNTKLPITDISYRAGFREVNNFEKMFKKYMSCSPSEYRKKLILQWEKRS